MNKLLPPPVRAVRLLSAAVLAALLAACSSGPQKPKPTPLESPAPASLRVQSLWNQRIGSLQQLPMRPAIHGDTLVAATADGTVVALQADSGKELWRASVGSELSAGVGSDGRFTAVVTRANQLVVLQGGQVAWRQALKSRVVTPPLVAGERVFIYAADRSVHAYDAASGAKLWSQQRPGDPLMLAQPGVLLPVRDTLVVGQGPRLAGLDPLRGSVRWEVPLAAPRGTNEVERLADLVGPPARNGDVVCARAFQSALGCVDAQGGVLQWSKNSAGATGLAGDGERVYGVDATDRLSAYRQSNGEVLWTSERFRFRGLSAPLALPGSVVVGDAEGYVHLLSATDGVPRARLQTDGSAVVGAPVLVGSTMVVLTRAGGVFAFRAQ
ncbi:outer membrane protein assembly factor BamB [Aquabacterium sp. A7-Y]|uniref:outer membrane protein assembly factor BamB n=1 Tax=Aquabacterium sp. A7-Y TaxID=1349605 RepID=UPI00223CBD3B|nr:outer membrane protein assembly factor BamB [Aquabacterium sp. A7-Y]MCW7540337.1 outer membrane protein assembly factor BamB [Aquabacterium sp. A7-Y]